MLNDALIAAEFQEARETIYLNAASTGPLPRRAVERLAAFNAKRAQPWTISFEEQFGGLARARELCARLIGASPDEIALTPNTSGGIHIAARVLPVAPGRVILSHDGEFPANVYPWMAMHRVRGTPFEQVPLRDGLPDHEALLARIARGDVGVVAISWVSFVSGDKADLARLGEACRRHGSWLAVDAIQGVGAAPLDVRDCHIDILSCGAQKWLCGPWGTAFTYVRRDLIARLDAETGGWLSMRYSDNFGRMLDYDATYFDDARKFEIATIAYQDFIGLNASLELLFEIGPRPIAAQVDALAARLLDGIASIPGLRPLTPAAPARRAGIVACAADQLGRVSQRLTEAGVVHGIRGGVLRFAPHFYNTADEIDRTLDVLRG